jgi:hypothetical protein
LQSAQIVGRGTAGSHFVNGVVITTQGLRAESPFKMSAALFELLWDLHLTKLVKITKETG